MMLPISLRACAAAGESPMKLQLITSAVVAYTILTLAWICYVGVGAAP
jgi:hypothetical protein